MPKRPIVTETTSRQVVGADASGNQVWMQIAREVDGRITIRLETQFRDCPGGELEVWIDTNTLRCLPFKPPGWWAAIKDPAKLYDAGDLCSVGPPDSNSLLRSKAHLVPGLVLQPCPNRADFYQVRQWDAGRYRWGPGRAVHFRQLRRAWG